MDINEKTAQLLYEYKQDIYLFFNNALGVTLDDQQRTLVDDAILPGSRVAVRSARGTGKTFLLAGLTMWWIITHDDVSIRIYSPSYDQLTTVFMREVRKLHNKLPPILKELIEIYSDKIVSKLDDTNFAKCITANADKEESLSGQHADTQVILFDEASAIDDEVYDVTLGSLGTARGGGSVVLTSNPTRSEGFYVDLFEKKIDRWTLLVFTAILCPRIPQDFIKEQIELYGEDSDNYRVNVLGKFPRADGSVFIPPAMVEESISRNVPYREYCNYEVVMGADIARSQSGDDTVFLIRQGPKVHHIEFFKTDDTMVTVARMRDTIAQYKVKTVYIDATGVGGPVGDRCRELGMPVIDVVVGSKSSDPTQYFNLRAQLYGGVRDWLPTGDLPDNDRLRKELGSIEWGYSGKMAIQLTAKKAMKSGRGKKFHSPDFADSFSLTMYETAKIGRRRSRGKRNVRKTEYLFC